MLPDIKPGSANKAGLLVAKSERGICRLLSHAPRHDLTLAGMETQSIRRVIDAWAFQFDKLGSLPWVRHVRIFENRGTLGAANPHPHTYVWGQEQLTNRTASKLREQRAYMVASRGRLLKDYLELELDRDQRVVCHNRDFAAVVPFWSSWPFETMILPRIYCGALSDLSPTERDNLADILQQVTRRYDLLFGATLPYSMSLHQRPTDGRSYSEWQLHIHFYPPLPRATSISPLLAGYELPDQPLQVAPEEAARILRTLTEEMREVGV
jgi:UDPglucose--hexose-1-phosphate uridylyltransferase